MWKKNFSQMRQPSNILCVLRLYLKFIKMKRILIILILTVVFAGAYAQQGGNVMPDNRLYSRFQAVTINNMVEKLPSEIVFWNWFADNGYVVKYASPEDAMSFPPLKFYDKDTKLAAEEEVAYDEATFNIMAYDFEILRDKSNAYRIGNTGYVVSILSDRELVINYNKHLSHE